MTISNEQKRQYRAIGHQLKPCVTLSDKGLHEGVVDEVFRALRDHELIKIKLAVYEREDRKALAAALVEATGAEIIQEIGKVILVFKKAGKPNQKLSNLRFLNTL
jgi:RNA-binding protein